jgi:hypothetical protein
VLEDIIDETIDEIDRRMVSGEFSIGLKPIKEFVRFYIIAEYIQNELENETTNILKYSENNFIPSESSKEDDIEQAERLEKEKWQAYERKVDHYNTLNFKKKLQLKIKKKKGERYKEIKKAENTKNGSKSATQEKKVIRNGPAERYKGDDLYKFQINEFKILDDIKEGKYNYDNLNRTYKRIISEKGYLKKMGFKELETFCDTLRKEIQYSDYAYKNIRYYKLEKTLRFELIKSILKAIHECKTRNLETDRMIDDFLILFEMPLLEERQAFVEEYPELDAAEIMAWRTEVLSINNFIIFAIKMCKGVLKAKSEYKLSQMDLERFKNEWNDMSFENNYKMRSDFDASDFLDLMDKLDQVNIKQHSQVNNFFSK